MTYPPSSGGGWSDPTSQSQPSSGDSPAYPPPTPGSGGPTYGQSPTYQTPGYEYPQQPTYQDPYAYPTTTPSYQVQPAYPAAGYGQQYGPAYVVARPTNGLAIASLVCSLAGFLIAISFPVGAIMGHIARRQIAESGEQGDGMALAGIIVGWIGLVLALAYLAFWIWLFTQGGELFPPDQAYPEDFIVLKA